MTYSDGINNQVFKYNITSGKTAEIKLPFAGSATVTCLDKKTNRCTVTVTSWVKAKTEFDFDASTEIFTPGIFNKPPAYPAAYNDLLVKEVQVKGQTG